MFVPHEPSLRHLREARPHHKLANLKGLKWHGVTTISPSRSSLTVNNKALSFPMSKSLVSSVSLTQNSNEAQGFCCYIIIIVGKQAVNISQISKAAQRKNITKKAN